MHCANPNCGAECLYFRSGSLHWVDSPKDGVAGKSLKSYSSFRHLVWLCSVCTRNCAVQTWRPSGEQIRELHNTKRPNDAYRYRSLDRRTFNRSMVLPDTKAS